VSALKLETAAIRPANWRRVRPLEELSASVNRAAFRVTHELAGNPLSDKLEAGAAAVSRQLNRLRGR
jgi:hypothetical protein